VKLTSRKEKRIYISFYFENKKKRINGVLKKLNLKTKDIPLIVIAPKKCHVLQNVTFLNPFQI